MGNVKAKILQN